MWNFISCVVFKFFIFCVIVLVCSNVGLECKFLIVVCFYFVESFFCLIAALHFVITSHLNKQFCVFIF